jgi:phosphate transport system ATP-binding protein
MSEQGGQSPESAPEPGAVATAVADKPIIAAHDVSVGFGSTTVISNLNLGFEPGTITAIIGPTGCGKSTLLRSINRMNDKVPGYWRSGRLSFNGVDVADKGTDPLVLRRRVGMVFQRPNPFPMSIIDNVVAGARAHRLAPRKDLPELAERCLSEVGLWPALAKRTGDSPFRLSGGQQQLLCLARAMAVDPDVLLLDEPTSSLDPIATETIENLLKKLVTRVTIIIVTHNLAQARRVAKNTAFLYAGRLVETGPTWQLFDAPREAETLSYVSGRTG